MAGRPKVPADKRASSWLQVRMRTRDKAEIVKAARRADQTLSEWAIDALLAAARAQK